MYVQCERYPRSDRKIANAIKKYKWEHMKFEIIEENSSWTNAQLDNREIYWIAFFDSVNTGYNMTKGGKGIDSACARKNALNHHASMTVEQKESRSRNCSKGQKLRYQRSPDSDETKKRKSDAHNGTYRIESPTGQVWITSLGLKKFSETFKNEINISYYQLFGAYRKYYSNINVTQTRVNNNKWKVIRIDKSNL